MHLGWHWHLLQYAFSIFLWIVKTEAFTKSVELQQKKKEKKNIDSISDQTSELPKI